MTLSLAHGNAADGIEVDERGAGDVRVDMFGTRISENGVFDPADLDDGFDIDEYDDGSVIGAIVLSAAVNNFEEGFDFNENNAGDLRVDMLLRGRQRESRRGHRLRGGRRLRGRRRPRDDDRTASAPTGTASTAATPA